MITGAILTTVKYFLRTLQNFGNLTKFVKIFETGTQAHSHIQKAKVSISVYLFI